MKQSGPNKSTSLWIPMVGSLQSVINISASFLATVRECASGCGALSNPRGNPCRNPRCKTLYHFNDTKGDTVDKMGSDKSIIPPLLLVQELDVLILHVDRQVAERGGFNLCPMCGCDFI